VDRNSNIADYETKENVNSELTQSRTNYNKCAFVGSRGRHH